MSELDDGSLDRKARGRIRGAASRAGARYAGAFGLLGVSAVILFIASITVLPEHLGVQHLVVAAGAFIPVLLYIAALRIGAERGVVAERAWVAKLPFSVPNYFNALATDPDRVRDRIWLQFAFATPLDSAARDELIALLGQDGFTWSWCEGEGEGLGERYERQSRSGSWDARSSERGEPLAGRELCVWAHKNLPRLHAFAVTHPFARVTLGGS